MSAPSAAIGQAQVRAVSLKRSKIRVGDEIFKWALRFCLLVAFAFLAWLVGYMVYRGWARLDSRLWENMPTGRVSRVAEAGVQSAITGTIWIMAVTAAICLPVGIFGAIYLEEYADNNRWYNRLLELNVQNLAGIPSIIFGILGLGLIVRQFNLGFTVRAAGIVLALLVLPIVIIATREAIRAVPQSIRQASYALGATKWQTVSKQVLPAAIPGISTGTILALSRAIGEAAPLIMMGAVTFVLDNPDGLDSAYTALPIHIYGLLIKPQAEFQELAAAAIVLLLGIVLVMNSVAIFVRNRFQKRW
ncbi:MAG TPA: phosphate ABC transporter permease PtsA [Micromonosporaceae bacterium]|nr:phosphate ABC transporter permease PtsA [Micromonosporaceae bacterium]HCU48419.1 phosphate ABC transporter permease PtsA [Micromonosporaceae bacterium]